MASPLRLGRIDYVNADPFFAASAPPPGVQVVPAKPTELNRQLLAGELDLSWISSVELLRHPDLLALCPPFCIAAPGPVLSVVLASPLAFEELEGHEIWLSDHSATSVALLRVLLADAGLRCRFRQYDHRAPLPDAPVLLIGDEALRLLGRPRPAVLVDLGERWMQTTGLPMVFAVLALRRRLMETPERLDAVAPALAWMAANRRAFEADPLGSAAFQRRRAGLDEPGYLRYFAGFQFDWDDHTQAGFTTFGERARALGLVPEGAPPAVYDPSRRSLLDPETVVLAGH